MNDNEKMREQEHVEHREDGSSGVPVPDDDLSVPKGYWYSYRFIGSMTAIVLLANNLFIGYAMPVSLTAQATTVMTSKHGMC